MSNQEITITYDVPSQGSATTDHTFTVPAGKAVSGAKLMKHLDEVARTQVIPSDAEFVQQVLVAYKH